MKKLSIIFANLIFVFYSHSCLSQDYWELVNAPDSVNIFDIAVDTEGRIYLACPFSEGNLTGIFRSDDNCETWQRKVIGMDTSYSPSTRSITIDNNDNVITSCDSRIYRSNNHGESWLQVYHATPASYSFNVTEFGFDSIVLVGGEYDNGIVRSGDNGLTWLRVLDFADFDPDYPESITGICFGPNGSIYACSRAYIGGYGSIYESLDLGLTWSVFYTNSASQFFSIEFDQAGRLLVGSAGIYRFDFSTGLWEHITYNIAPFEILAHSDSIIYLACSGDGAGAGGVAISQNGGDTYEFVNSGMTWPDAEDLAIDRVGRLLVSGNSHYLYRSYDTLITGLENIKGEINGISFFCYPNPIDDFLYINSTIEQEVTIKIWSQMGNQIIDKKLITFGVTTIPFHNYDHGLYIAHVIMNKRIYVFKIVH